MMNMSIKDPVVPIDPRFPEKLDPAFHEALRAGLEQSNRREVIPHEIVMAQVRAKLKNASKDNMGNRRSRKL
jgi:hypothetical protein